jgi:GDP-L-fucose synthase
VWGDGTARREFTYVGEVASWLVGAADTMAEWPPLLNVGAGVDESVLDIYRTAARVTGFTGDFELQPNRPAGMHQKLLDSSRAAEWGWAPSTSLEEGMRSAFSAYLARSA